MPLDPLTRGVLRAVSAALLAAHESAPALQVPELSTSWVLKRTSDGIRYLIDDRWDLAQQSFDGAVAGVSPTLGLHPFERLMLLMQSRAVSTASIAYPVGPVFTALARALLYFSNDNRPRASRLFTCAVAEARGVPEVP